MENLELNLKKDSDVFKTLEKHNLKKDNNTFKDAKEYTLSNEKEFDFDYDISLVKKKKNNRKIAPVHNKQNALFDEIKNNFSNAFSINNAYQIKHHELEELYKNYAKLMVLYKQKSDCESALDEIRDYMDKHKILSEEELQKLLNEQEDIQDKVKIMADEIDSDFFSEKNRQFAKLSEREKENALQNPDDFVNETVGNIFFHSDDKLNMNDLEHLPIQYHVAFNHFLNTLYYKENENENGNDYKFLFEIFNTEKIINYERFENTLELKLSERIFNSYLQHGVNTFFRFSGNTFTFEPVEDPAFSVIESAEFKQQEEHQVYFEIPFLLEVDIPLTNVHLFCRKEQKLYMIYCYKAKLDKQIICYLSRKRFNDEINPGSSECSFQLLQFPFAEYEYSSSYTYIDYVERNLRSFVNVSTIPKLFFSNIGLLENDYEHIIEKTKDTSRSTQLLLEKFKTVQFNRHHYFEHKIIDAIAETKSIPNKAIFRYINTHLPSSQNSEILLSFENTSLRIYKYISDFNGISKSKLYWLSIFLSFTENNKAYLNLFNLVNLVNENDPDNQNDPDKEVAEDLELTYRNLNNYTTLENKTTIDLNSILSDKYYFLLIKSYLFNIDGTQMENIFLFISKIQNQNQTQCSVHEWMKIPEFTTLNPHLAFMFPHQTAPLLKTFCIPNHFEETTIPIDNFKTICENLFDCNLMEIIDIFITNLNLYSGEINRNDKTLFLDKISNILQTDNIPVEDVFTGIPHLNNILEIYAYSVLTKLQKITWKTFSQLFHTRILHIQFKQFIEKQTFNIQHETIPSIEKFDVFLKCIVDLIKTRVDNNAYGTLTYKLMLDLVLSYTGFVEVSRSDVQSQFDNDFSSLNKN